MLWGLQSVLLFFFLSFFVVVSSILSGVDDAILEKIALLPAMQLMSWSFVSVSRAGRQCRLWSGAAAAVSSPLSHEHHMQSSSGSPLPNCCRNRLFHWKLTMFIYNNTTLKSPVQWSLNKVLFCCSFSHNCQTCSIFILTILASLRMETGYLLTFCWKLMDLFKRIFWSKCLQWHKQISINK